MHGERHFYEMHQVHCHLHHGLPSSFALSAKQISLFDAILNMELSDVCKVFSRGNEKYSSMVGRTVLALGLVPSG